MTDSAISHPARMMILSAPSGAGKTSLARALVDVEPGAALSISHTTRDRRPGETDGVHYHFVDHGTFESMIERDLFLEYAQVFDNYYGTSRDAVDPQIEAGTSVVLDIDWQGARKVRARMPESVSVFILPPSRQALSQRLSDRGRDSADVIERRMRDAASEASHFGEYDWVVINDDFDQALAELRAILAGQPTSHASSSDRVKALVASLSEPA